MVKIRRKSFSGINHATKIDQLKIEWQKIVATKLNEENYTKKHFSGYLPKNEPTGVLVKLG